MTQIMTPNGIAYISNPTDAGNICRDFIGEDMARYVEENLVNVEQETIYAKEKVNSDLDAYEGEIEGYRNMLFEIQSIVENLMVDEWEKKNRVNTKNIYKKLEHIDNYIQKNL